MKQVQNHQSGAARAKVLVVLLLVLLLVGAGLGILRLLQKPAYEVAGNTFIHDLAANDSTDTYHMMTPRLQSQAGGQQGWTQSVTSAFNNTNATTKLITSTVVPDATATYAKTADPHRLTYSFDFGNGKKYDMYIIVLNDKGSWKVDEYDTSFAK